MSVIDTNITIEKVEKNEEIYDDITEVTLAE